MTTSEDYRLSLLVDWHDLDQSEQAQIAAEDYEAELDADVARDGGW